jgi:polar amino acid transport system ATP-binding protein
MKLKVENLSFAYPQEQGQQQVFQDLSFECNFDSLLLMGPSGGGKSTLMRLLCGLEIPQVGSIEWDSQVLPKKESELREFRKKTGVVFQAFNLFPHLTAIENICLPLVKVHRIGKDDAYSRAMIALKVFSLHDHADKMPSQLSGGQKQRVAILRAMITKPQILFLDEPTSALDPYMTSEVFRMITDMKSQYPCPLVLVTHHVSFAQKIKGEVVILANGKILKTGTSAELLKGAEEDIFQKLLV